MKSKYKSEFIDNIFRGLDKEHSFYLMGLSLASNDLATNLDSFKYFPVDECNYFFSNSISILRELALLVDAIDKSTLKQKYAINTNVLFEDLKSELVPFHDDSLARATLKPVRDSHFHYDFNKFNEKEKEKLELTFESLKELENIEIGFDPGDNSPRGQRYTFADIFRTEFTDQYLTQKIASNISAVAVNIVCFIDSLMFDLNYDK